MTTEPAAWLHAMTGRRLAAVVEARHWHEGRRGGDAESLLHVWLFFENAAPIGLSGVGDRLLLSEREPDRPADMGEYGEIRVGPAESPDLLAGFAGRRLTGGEVVAGPDLDGACSGLRLRFGDDTLVIRTVADEWVLEASTTDEANVRTGAESEA